MKGWWKKISIKFKNKKLAERVKIKKSNDVETDE